ncbi:MAG: TonB-dependent receptor, partial [Gammaproteobacteria bacterium]|nr:TonB-dependent receptor [Gammaproteobacteria bacterium]
MSRHLDLRHGLWMASLALAVPSQVGNAQPADSASALAIDEVVVTARKREENLQDVPLAVTAISAGEIQRQGIKSVEEVIGRDPSLSYDLGIAPYDTRIVIRGLSPTRGRPNVATLVDGIDISSEAIGTAGGSLLINPRLVDVERIEVVKGPQSALYGRSAFAGAIQYISKDPSDELDGDITVEAGNLNRYDVKGSISLPFTDTLGIRLNGYRFEDGGYYRNSVTGARVGGGEGTGGSLTLKWAPGEVYSLKFRADYADDSFDQQAQALLAFNSVMAVPAEASSCRVYSIVNPATNQTIYALGPVLDPSCTTLTVGTAAPVLNPVRRLETATGNNRYFNDMAIRSYRGAVPGGKGLAVAYNPDHTRSTNNGLSAPDFPGSNRQVARFSLVQEAAVDFGTFALYSGYTRGLAAANFDFDKTASTSIWSSLNTDSKTEQMSHELRFTSDFEGPVQVIGGLQYWEEEALQVDTNHTVIASGIACVITSPIATTCPPPAFGTGFTTANVVPYMDEILAARVPTFTGREVEHKSVYAEIEWALTDTLQLIAEARYVDEDNSVLGAFTGGTVAAPGPGTGAAGTVTLCGATGNCNVAASIPYPASPATPVRTFAGAAVTGYGIYERNDSYVTPKGTIQWRPSESLNLYASFAKAQKPGGFSTLQIGAAGLGALDGVEFLPEKMKVY